jgi:hypothetical protein
MHRQLTVSFRLQLIPASPGPGLCGKKLFSVCFPCKNLRPTLKPSILDFRLATATFLSPNPGLLNLICFSPKRRT